MTSITKTRWFMPAFTFGLGLCCFAALWIGGDLWGAVWALALLTGLAIVVLLGRSDLIRGLRGDGRDEYWARIDVHATALAGNVLIGVVIAMCFWEWAHGNDGTPYAQLGAIAGVAYLVGLGVLRWRS